MHQHLVDFGHHHWRRAAPPRTPGRPAFLQPGAADGAGRGRFSGLATDPAVATTLFTTAAAWGKTPVHAKSSPGFIVNRVARPYYAEALRLAQEGAADCATIDAVMREAGGFRMGPFELMDMIGHDVNFAVTHSVWRAFFHDQRFLPSLLQQELVDAGHLGRKSGRGFYDYRDGAARPVPNSEPAQPAPAKIALFGESTATIALAAHLAATGIACERPAASDGRIAEADGAVLYVTDGRSATRRAAESGCSDTVLIDLALDFGTATRIAIAAAVDVAMCLGVNYPRGPLAWADSIGLPAVRDVLAKLGAAYGDDRYRTSPLLHQMVFARRKFHD